VSKVTLLPAVRRLALIGAVVIGVLAWNSAFASTQPVVHTARPETPHIMLGFDKHATGHSKAGKPGKGGSFGPHNSCCTVPLINNGGPVESPAKVYLDFWGPQWSAGWPDVAYNDCGGSYYNTCTIVAPTAYSNAAPVVMNYVQDFFKAVAAGTKPTWNDSQSQYGSKVPPLYGSSFIDSSSAPPTPIVSDSCSAVVVCITGSGLTQLEMEAQNAEAHFGYSPNADYMIFLPQGSSPVGFGEFCAYHGETVDSQNRKITYSVIPYLPDVDKSGAVSCGENYINTTNDAYGHGFLDGYSIVGGHEFAEAETDPFPFTAPGWQGSDGNETGDICAWGTVTTYPAGNIRGSGNFWAVQSLWSNSARACVMN
jgi:hypothetical protein